MRCILYAIYQILYVVWTWMRKSLTFTSYRSQGFSISPLKEISATSILLCLCTLLSCTYSCFSLSQNLFKLLWHGCMCGILILCSLWLFLYLVGGYFSMEATDCSLVARKTKWKRYYSFLKPLGSDAKISTSEHVIVSFQILDFFFSSFFPD